MKNTKITNLEDLSNQYGWRHTNDKEDIREIRFAPDLEEILCPFQAHIPTADSTFEAYVEKQFRMQREEALRGYMKAMQWLIREGHEKVHPDHDFIKSTSQSLNAVFNVFHNFGHKTKDTYTFDLPAGAGKSATSQWKYWNSGSGSKDISVKCPMMMMYRRDGGETRFYPCQVIVPVQAMEPSTDQNGNTYVQAPECEIDVKILNSPWQEKNYKSQRFLIGLRGMFFMTPQAVLENLKELKGNMPFLKQIQVPPGPPGALQPQFDKSQNYAPAYLRERKLDFPIGADDFKDPKLLGFEIGDTYETTLSKFKFVPFALGLDQSQLEAFVASITHPVALIQGPPGTGKSFVGVYIARFLLLNTAPCVPSPPVQMDLEVKDDQMEENGEQESLSEAESESVSEQESDEGSEAILPILVVAQTNHALDEFLMSLISSGAVSRREVLRMGKSLTREELRPCLLLRDDKGSLMENACERARACKVVGITTSGCAINPQLIDELKPKIIICEEDSEVLECHMLMVLSDSTEHLILIGDHMQLSPKVTEMSLVGEPLNFDRSLFERLVSPFDAVGDKQRAGRVVTLNVQRRMHPSISQLIRHPELYPNLKDTIRTDESVPAGFPFNVWFLDHNGPESQPPNSTSHRNLKEARIALQLAKFLVYQGDRDIVIISPYQAQIDEFNKMLDEPEYHLQLEVPLYYGTELQTLPLRDFIRLATIDSFQGEESGIVILSLVRNNAQGGMGFLNRNRINVMLSRAKHCLVILGSTSTIAKKRGKNQSAVLSDAVKTLQSQNRVYEELPLRCLNHSDEIQYAHPDELDKYCKDGGCDRPCGGFYRCGHACPKNCHFHDRAHIFDCPIILQKIYPGCLHVQNYSCSGPVPYQCPELVAVEALKDCPHLTVPCHMLKERELPGYRCRQPCPEICQSCKQTCLTPCFECAHNDRKPKRREQATCLRCQRREEVPKKKKKNAANAKKKKRR